MAWKGILPASPRVVFVVSLMEHYNIYPGFHPNSPAKSLVVMNIITMTFVAPNLACQGARREHIPKWICDRRAAQPQAKFGATLRAAVLFRPDFVARSSQTPEGFARRSRLVWLKNPSPRTSS